MASLLIVLFIYIYSALSWVFGLMFVLLSFLTVALKYAIYWLIYCLDISSQIVFGLAFPAFFVTASFTFVFGFPRNRIAERFELSNKSQVASEVVCAIILGQIFIAILPSSLQAVVTNPIVIMMALSVFLYGLRYRLVLSSGIETLPDNICVVCLTNPKAVLVKPCNHFALCEECIRQLDECPICRSTIEHQERIYTS